MDMNTVITFISNIGFPIAVCVMCFWYINKTNEERGKEREASTTAINNMAHAVENNTTATTQMVTVLTQWLPVLVTTETTNTNFTERDDGYE